MKRSMVLSLTALLFSISFSAYAQQDNFSGTWQFKNQQSVSGNLYANGSPKQVTINQNNSLAIALVMNYGAQDTTITEVFSSTAKPFETKTAMGRRDIITLKWADNHSNFTVISLIYDLNDPAKLDFRDTDIWKISDGQLILDRKSENFTNGETWESTATYTKQ